MTAKARAMAVLGLSLVCSMSFAQDAKGVLKIIVPFPPGGGTDVLARMLAPKLSKELGIPAMVDNKPGASGQIGTQFVKNAPADGLTVLMTPESAVVIQPLLVQNVPYTAQDFMALGLVTRYQWVLSVPSASGIKSLDDFTTQVKNKAVAGNYGVPVVGGMPDLVGRVLSSHSKLDFVAVPFGGGAPMMAQLVGGQVSSGVSAVTEALPMRKGGKLTMLAITGTHRSSRVPDVPTFEELGYKGASVNTWNAFFAHKNTPPAVAERFNAALRKTLSEPDIKAKINEMDLDLANTTLAQAAQELQQTAEFWQKVYVKPVK